MKNRSTPLNRCKKQKTDNIKSSYLTGSTYFKHELEYIQRGHDFVIGVDEAGRGPLAGPVVAAAVSLRNFEFRISNFETNPNFQNYNLKIDSKFKIQNSKFLNKIRDSKLLSEKQREELYDFIHDHFHVGIGICDHRTIDRVNILNATYLAMKKAIIALIQDTHKSSSPACGRGCLAERDRRGGKNEKFSLIRPAQRDTFSQREKGNYNKNNFIILVDGNRIVPNCSHNQKAIVNGDKIVKSISAASIVAKVTRDRIMHKMDKKYPKYGFSRHKGYGTKEHREMIKKHGACAIHRQSFKLL